MDLSLLQRRAEELRLLHGLGRPRSRVLLLANVWDVASALAVEAAGFPALATASAGISASLGYRDGEHIPRDEMMQVVARIARAVRVPVTADLEGGYGDPAATVAAALRAGAVGMNLEDSNRGDPALASIDVQAGKIHSARDAANRIGVAFVINARTDVYLLRGGSGARSGAGSGDDGFAETIDRARAYLAAGADCIFVPGVRDETTIGRLAASIGGPLNVLAGAGSPEVATLFRLGVARVSTGPMLMRTALTAARRAAEELRDRGTFSSAEGNITGAELDALLARD